MKKLIEINSFKIDPSKLFLRTSDGGISYGNFKRKPVGQWNKAKNWTGIPTCEECGGFFGIDKKFNSFGLLPRNTIELCKWREERVVIDNNKICVSEYRVIAVNENIPDRYFEECGYKVLRRGGFVIEISSGKWIIFGGIIDEISGGYQEFHDKVSAGDVKISGGVQYFYNDSSADEAEITGGTQHFHKNSSAGKAEMSGGKRHFHDKSSAGNAKITDGKQYFYDDSSAGKARISGGIQHFHGRSSAGNAKITGGRQYFDSNSSADNAKISGGAQYFYDDSSAGDVKISGGMQHFYSYSLAGNAKVSGGMQYFYNRL